MGVWSFVLEIGVVEAEQVDSGWCVTQQCRSWCVIVRNCRIHDVNPVTAPITVAYMERERGERHQDALSDTPGTKATLNYGVVLNLGSGRVGFIDLDREDCSVHQEFGESLFPVSSAGDSSSGYTVSMSLISGEEFDKVSHLPNIEIGSYEGSHETL